MYILPLRGPVKNKLFATTVFANGSHVERATSLSKLATIEGAPAEDRTALGERTVANYSQGARILGKKDARGMLQSIDDHDHPHLAEAGTHFSCTGELGRNGVCA